jgi:hypothetical protein
LKQCGNLLRGYYSTPSPLASTAPMFNPVNPDAGLPITPSPSPEALAIDTPIAGEFGWVEEAPGAAPPAGFFPPGGLTHGAPRAWWPWLFPLLGLPFIGGGGGGGGGFAIAGPAPVFVPTSGEALTAVVQPSVEIPEPGAAVWLVSLSGVGAALVAWRRRRGLAAAISRRKQGRS